MLHRFFTVGGLWPGRRYTDRKNLRATPRRIARIVRRTRAAINRVGPATAHASPLFHSWRPVAGATIYRSEELESNAKAHRAHRAAHARGNQSRGAGNGAFFTAFSQLAACGRGDDIPIGRT